MDIARRYIGKFLASPWTQIGTFLLVLLPWVLFFWIRSASGNAFLAQKIPQWVAGQYPAMQLKIGHFETDLISKIHIKEMKVSVSSGEDLLYISSMILHYGVSSGIELRVDSPTVWVKGDQWTRALESFTGQTAMECLKEDGKVAVAGR